MNIITDGSRNPPLEFIYYPYSHSLLMVIGWAALFAAAYFMIRNSRIGAAVLGLAVISHWLLDLAVHYPDLPLYPGNSQLLGFSIWSSPVIAMGLELAIFAAGVWLYLRSTRANDATGRWAPWTLIVALLLIQIANAFGSPPPSATAIAWVGQAQWLLVIWGYWADRHRHPAHN